MTADNVPPILDGRRERLRINAFFKARHDDHARIDQIASQPSSPRSALCLKQPESPRLRQMDVELTLCRQSTTAGHVAVVKTEPILLVKLHRPSSSQQTRETYRLDICWGVIPLRLATRHFQYSLQQAMRHDRVPAPRTSPLPKWFLTRMHSMTLDVSQALKNPN